MNVFAKAVVLMLLSLLIVDRGVAQSADTTVVRVGAPLHPGVGTLVEELTLGRGSAAVEYQFTVPKVFSAPDGGVYVIDVTNPFGPGQYNTTVRLYDATGKFIRAFGRTGQGPGEYSGVVKDVKSLADGRVLVLDRQGVLVYSTGGASLSRWATGDPATGLLIDPTGFVNVSVATPVRVGESIRTLVRFRLDGTLVDRRASPESEFPAAPRLMGDRLPFGSQHMVRWSPRGYFVTVNTASYQIDLRGATGSGSGALWAAGDPVLSMRRTTLPVPISSAERADWRQSFSFYWRRQGYEWNGPPEIPLVKPPISELQIATDGRIWVRVSQPAVLNPLVRIRTTVRPDEFIDIDAARRWVEPWVYDVFEPSGQYVGQVLFPENTAPPTGLRVEFAIQGDTVWGVVFDKDEVPTIKRYRINWGGR